MIRNLCLEIDVLYLVMSLFSDKGK